MASLFVILLLSTVSSMSSGGLLGNYEPHDPPTLSKTVKPCPLFSDEEVSRSFDRLSNKKSSGMDSISGYFIKIFKSQLTIPLRKLFNLIITE